MNDEPLTATEVIERQNQATEWLDETVKEAVEQFTQDTMREVRRMSEIRIRADRLQDELMAANPQYSDTTMKIARMILESHPKMNKLVDSFEVLLPYVLAVAYDLETEIETKLPKEWRNAG